MTNHPGDKARGANVRTDIALDLAQPLPRELERSYEVVFNHTVLEHIEDPVFAFEQIAAMSTDLVISVVPFKQKLHFESGMYGDWQRFTPFGMRKLHERNGFQVIYESYTPRPALDVYLFYVGAREPDLHVNCRQDLCQLDDLNQLVGGFSASDLLENVLGRFISKYLQ